MDALPGPTLPRFRAARPLGTITFVAALRCGELTAPMLTDGPMDGEFFLAYVNNFLWGGHF